MDKIQYWEIELRHIKLELDNNRFQHLRHFVDQYYCYKNGYIKRTGTADWEKIVWGENEAISEGATKTQDRKLVVKEHIVPLKRITEELKKLVVNSTTEIHHIQECIEKYLFYATISKEEDKKLRNLKLTSKMPDEFDDSSHELFQDIYARYKLAGINLVQTKTS
ncbi:MAG: hypothetical protein ACJAS1_005177 [Oleiphilaceae bacterium]|jgi:hypothetical protein